MTLTGFLVPVLLAAPLADEGDAGLTVRTREMMSTRVTIALVDAPADVERAFDAAFAKHGPKARVTVLTHAPDMLPIITPAVAVEPAKAREAVMSR